MEVRILLLSCAVLLLVTAGQEPDVEGSGDVRGVHGGRCELRHGNSDNITDDSITSLCVVGERHSGTNFLATLLRENVAFAKARHPEMVRSVGSGPLLEPGSHQALYGYGCTKHKHKFQEERGETFVDMNRTLAVLIVRNPYDWFTAFYRFPWDTIYPPFNEIPLGGRRRRGAVRAMAFASMPWNTSVDKHAGDAPHRNLADMRTRKLLSTLEMPWPHLEVVQYECLIADGGHGAERWLDDVMTRYHLPRVHSLADDARAVPVVSLRYKGGARFAAERQAGVGLRVDLRAKEADSAYAAPPNDAHTRMLAALLNPKLNATLERRLGYELLPSESAQGAI